MSLRRYRWLVVFVVVFAGLVGGGYACYRDTFPYGHSHCCDKQLAFLLLNYADSNGGWFPKGEATPEASLSLLHRKFPEWVTANLLRGKTVPESAVQARLDEGKLLTPDTCGWHYVEGLRKDDDPKLALFWDKAGLGHFGERLPKGGHRVGFVSGWIDYVTGDRWEEFVAEQKRLRVALKR